MPLSYVEYTITIPDQFKEPLIKRLTEMGCLGAIESDDALIAYFPGELDTSAIQTELQLQQALLAGSGTGRAHELSFTSARIPSQDWNESWKKGFQPVDAGKRFTIIPPWEQPREGRVNLIIDPAMAFGTGHHETTRSCLVLMEKHADAYSKERFLDLGTGTGILAIAAAKIGYRHVTGIDTDLLAVDAAYKNILLNEVPDVVIRQGSLTEDESVYDVIAANLISGILVQFANVLSQHLDSNGISIQSGILRGQENEVIHAMEHAGLTLLEKYPDGKWISLVMSHRRKS